MTKPSKDMLDMVRLIRSILKQAKLQQIGARTGLIMIDTTITNLVQDNEWELEQDWDIKYSAKDLGADND